MPPAWVLSRGSAGVALVAIPIGAPRLLWRDPLGPVDAGTLACASRGRFCSQSADNLRCFSAQLMLYSVAKLAINLNVDHVANTVVERFYSNGRNVSARLSKRFQILAYHHVPPGPPP